MLKPGEQVVAATHFRDFVLVFGSYGTVLKIFYSENYNMLAVEVGMDLGYRS